MGGLSAAHFKKMFLETEKLPQDQRWSAESPRLGWVFGRGEEEMLRIALGNKRLSQNKPPRMSASYKSNKRGKNIGFIFYTLAMTFRPSEWIHFPRFLLRAFG